jgi:hypothetical protein
VVARTQLIDLGMHRGAIELRLRRGRLHLVHRGVYSVGHNKLTRDYGLDVTDTTPNTLQVRALATAKDADDIWTVRVTVREKMIRWLAEEHPYALPRVNTADALLPPNHANGRVPGGIAPQRRAHESPRADR